MHKDFLKSGLGLLLVLFLSTSGVAKEQYMQVRLYPASQAELIHIKKLNLDITYIKPGEYIDIVSTPGELNRLQLLGFKTDVIHPDLVEFNQSRLDPTLDMGGYHTYDETVAELDTIHLLYPSITTDKINIGTTIEGRTIWAMKISDNPETDEDEPEVFYNGLTHAREPITIELLLYYMKYLVNNYSTDPEIEDIVNNTELWFVPICNPDGYVYNQTEYPLGGGMWRKNRRDNGDGTYGVDLNRNFGYGWGHDDVGSSPHTSSETYRGTGPFSEPETQVIRDFINAHDFVIVLNYHSYSNLYIYPWGYELQYPEDYLIYKEISDSMSAYNGYTPGPDWVVLWYTTNGTAADWEYGDWSGKNKIICFIPEVGSADDYFWPPTYRIQPLCQENLGPNIYVAKKAGELYNRPYRFFETQPNFIDTSLISGDSLILNLRVVGHQSSGDLTWTVYDPDSFEITTPLSLSQRWSTEKFTKEKKDWYNLKPASSFYTVVNWLRVEPQNGQVSPGGYFDHQVILDAKQLPSQCVGTEVNGAIIFYVSNGIASDSIIIPVIFLSGPPKQQAGISTARIRNDITNLTSINDNDDYGWRYLDEPYSNLFEGTLFLAFLGESGDTIVHRDIFKQHSIGASSVLDIDSSGPRWQKGSYSAADYDCEFDIRGEVLAPSHPDSSELMIHRFMVTNLSSDTIINLHIGMIVDWDIPYEYWTNYADYDSSLNLLWQQGSGNRHAGMTYLADDPIYGAKALRNDLHVYPTSNFETGDLYQFISSPGYYIEGSSYDLISILTAKVIDLNPDDSISLDFALVSTRTSLDALKASVQKARILAGIYMPGDANGDRDITISDVIYLINYLFKGGPAPSPLLAGDADCNGELNISDVIYLINYLFKGGPAPCT